MRFSAMIGSAVSIALVSFGATRSSAQTTLAPRPPALRIIGHAAGSFAGEYLQTGSAALPGNAPSNVPDRSPGFATLDAAATAAVVISDANQGAVYAFTRKRELVATITGLHEPQGLAVDPGGNIYVANTLDNDIVVYKNDYKTRLATLADPGELPVGVSYDRGTGTVGVTNIARAGGYYSGSVTFYAKGQTTACLTLHNVNFANVYFGAFNAHGDFYLDGFNYKHDVLVGLISGGCKATQIRLLHTGNTLTFPGGIVVAPNGDVLIDDQSRCAVYTYNAARFGSLGAPIATTPLTVASDPISFALTRANQRLWATNFAYGIATEYGYPRGNIIHGMAQKFVGPAGLVVTPRADP